MPSAFLFQSSVSPIWSDYMNTCLRYKIWLFYFYHLWSQRSILMCFFWQCLCKLLYGDNGFAYRSFGSSVFSAWGRLEELAAMSGFFISLKTLAKCDTCLLLGFESFFFLSPSSRSNFAMVSLVKSLSKFSNISKRPIYSVPNPSDWAPFVFSTKLNMFSPKPNLSLGFYWPNTGCSVLLSSPTSFSWVPLSFLFSFSLVVLSPTPSLADYNTSPAISVLWAPSRSFKGREESNYPTTFLLGDSPFLR